VIKKYRAEPLTSRNNLSARLPCSARIEFAWYLWHTAKGKISFTSDDDKPENNRALPTTGFSGEMVHDPSRLEDWGNPPDINPVSVSDLGSNRPPSGHFAATGDPCLI
jgi:hypothetical protein